MAKIEAMDGPIPGENFTSDTRNYSWHRPPDYTDMNDAVDFCITHLTKKQPAFGVLAALEAGVTVAQATRAIVISGIADGKWTPDFAILLAGPVARIVQTIANGYGIKAELGIDPDKDLPTLSAIKFDPDEVISKKELDDKIEDKLPEASNSPVRKGFASRPAEVAPVTNDVVDPVEETEGTV